MPKIDINASLTPDDVLMSSMIYGVSRAGKTHLQATYPRPFIIASAREGGYRTLQNMKREAFFEPSHPPEVRAVSTIKETVGYLEEAWKLVKVSKVLTIVVELSFYSDDIVSSVKGGNNAWAPYKLLSEHIMFLDTECKKRGCRIAYNALAADPGDTATKAPAGVAMAGKALARMIPAATDLTGYLRTEEKGNGLVDRVLHLNTYGVYPAGHRYGDRLPALVRNPSFKKLADLLAGVAHVDEQGNVLPGPPVSTITSSGQVDSTPPEGLPTI